MSEIEDLLDKVFGKAKKIGDRVAVFAQKKVSRQVRFSVNKIDVAKEWEELKRVNMELGKIEKKLEGYLHELGYLKEHGKNDK